MNIKIGCKVKLRNKMLNWHLNHIDVFEAPNGQMRHHEEISVLLGEHSGLFPMQGEVLTKLNEHGCRKVEFTSRLGKFSAWFEDKDLKRI